MLLASSLHAAVHSKISSVNPAKPIQAKWLARADSLPST